MNIHLFIGGGVVVKRKGYEKERERERKNLVSSNCCCFVLLVISRILLGSTMHIHFYVTFLYHVCMFATVIFRMK